MMGERCGSPGISSRIKKMEYSTMTRTSKIKHYRTPEQRLFRAAGELRGDQEPLGNVGRG